MYRYKLDVDMMYEGIELKGNNHKTFKVGNTFISGQKIWEDLTEDSYYEEGKKYKYVFGDEPDSWGTFLGYYENGKKQGKFYNITNSCDYITFKNDIPHGPYECYGRSGVMDNGVFTGRDNTTPGLEKMMAKMVSKRVKKTI